MMRQFLVRLDKKNIVVPKSGTKTWLYVEEDDAYGSNLGRSAGPKKRIFGSFERG